MDRSGSMDDLTMFCDQMVLNEFEELVVILVLGVVESDAQTVLRRDFKIVLE